MTDQEHHLEEAIKLIENFQLHEIDTNKAKTYARIAIRFAMETDKECLQHIENEINKL